MSGGGLAGLEADLSRWLVGHGLDEDDEGALLGGFCERLAAAGIPVSRVASGSGLLHPVLDARGWRWLRESGLVGEEYERARWEETGREEQWRRSPFHHLHESKGTELRRRLGGSYEQGEFPLLDDFVRAGCTDYVAFAVRFGEASAMAEVEGMMLSLQTDRPGGFGDAEVDLFRRVVPLFGLAYKAIIGVHTSRVLLETYLGADPARRVLQGAIERGKAETIQAVLWFSDLQGFTQIADTAPKDQILELLNDYADCLVTTIAAHQGEVLKFMGDGILAIFPTHEVSPCGRALDAAEAALDRIDRLNERRAGAGLPFTGVHLALHVGEVLYGNIGSRDRLDFTVVGPAVNEVSRIEAMCRNIDQRVVISSAFAEAAGDQRRRLVSLGRYALRGVRRPEELFTLDPEPASAAA